MRQNEMAVLEHRSAAGPKPGIQRPALLGLRVRFVQTLIAHDAAASFAGTQRESVFN